MKKGSSGSGKKEARPKGDGVRTKRVEKEILHHLSKYVAAAFRGELPGLLCLNRVIVTADLRSARVFFSIINGNESDENLALEWLEERAPDMQAKIGRDMKMRYTPKLTFESDTTMDRALKIDRLLHEVSKNK